jgi:hypothetical protein
LMRNMPENGDATSRQVSDISLCIWNRKPQCG